MKKLLYPLLLAILILTAGCDFLPFGGNELPVAYIDSISPSSAAVGETVTFVGHGTDADGTVVGYQWRSSIDGDIGSLASFDCSALSEGNHVISLRVQDNNGDWSEEVESVVIVSGAAVEPTEEEDYYESSQPEALPETTIPTALPYINHFTAEPAIISPGGSSTVSWDVSNAESVTVGYGMSTEVVPSVGTATARPTSTTTYTLTATSGASTVSATVTVAVEGAGVHGTGVVDVEDLPVINSFTASPATIDAGGSSTLSWDVSNATLIQLGGGTKTASLTHPVDSTVVEPTSTTTYTLTATNSAGSVNDTAKVTVLTYKTKELSIITGESGSVSSDHTVGTKLVTGDSTTNKTSWAYFSFDISALAGKQIAKAELYCPPSGLNGKPWPDLVSLGVYQVNHGPRPLKGSDFTFVGPTIVDDLGQLALLIPVDVTSQVQNAATARAPRFQVRINFVKMTDSDNKADNISWTSNDARLRVTYR